MQYLMLLEKCYLMFIAQDQKQKFYVLYLFVTLESGIMLELWINMQGVWGVVENNIVFHLALMHLLFSFLLVSRKIICFHVGNFLIS